MTTTDFRPNVQSEEIERLLTCANQATVYRGPSGVPLALIPGETLNQWNVSTLRSHEFTAFLREDFHEKYGEFPNDPQLRIARDLLDQRAARRTFSGIPAALRIARGRAEHARLPGDSPVYREAIALDLGRADPDSQDLVLEIDKDGWAVNNCSDFSFVRPRGYRPIPYPEPAGPEALAELKSLLRVDDHGFLRILTWLLAAMRPKGPYPILLLQGETGSGKSQAAAMLRNLLDPVEGQFQPLPNNPNALLKQANQAWIQVFDHITGIPKEIQSALCRLSTKATFNLPTDPRDYPIPVSLARPILLTVPTQAQGGASWRPRPDLLDRTLTVTLPNLTSETRRPESEIEERFERLRPRILGALAQAVSEALRREKEIHLETYPRNSEAAIWAIAAIPEIESTLQDPNEFQLPKDPLIQKIITLMDSQSEWQGTATKLQMDLDIPTSPNRLTRKLREIQEILALQGIELAFPRTQTTRTIQITKGNTQPIASETTRHTVTEAVREREEVEEVEAAARTASVDPPLFLVVQTPASESECIVAQELSPANALPGGTASTLEPKPPVQPEATITTTPQPNRHTVIAAPPADGQLAGPQPNQPPAPRALSASSDVADDLANPTLPGGAPPALMPTLEPKPPVQPEATMTTAPQPNRHTVIAAPPADGQPAGPQPNEPPAPRALSASYGVAGDLVANPADPNQVN